MDTLTMHIDQMLNSHNRYDDSLCHLKISPSYKRVNTLHEDDDDDDDSLIVNATMVGDVLFERVSTLPDDSEEASSISSSSSSSKLSDSWHRSNSDCDDNDDAEDDENGLRSGHSSSPNSHQSSGAMNLQESFPVSSPAHNTVFNLPVLAEQEDEDHVDAENNEGGNNQEKKEDDDKEEENDEEEEVEEQDEDELDCVLMRPGLLIVKNDLFNDAMMPPFYNDVYEQEVVPCIHDDDDDDDDNNGEGDDINGLSLTQGSVSSDRDEDHYDDDHVEEVSNQNHHQNAAKHDSDVDDCQRSAATTQHSYSPDSYLHNPSHHSATSSSNSPSSFDVSFSSDSSHDRSPQVSLKLSSSSSSSSSSSPSLPPPPPTQQLQEDVTKNENHFDHNDVENSSSYISQASKVTASSSSSSSSLSLLSTTVKPTNTAKPTNVAPAWSKLNLTKHAKAKDLPMTNMKSETSNEVGKTSPLVGSPARKGWSV
jgi:hypothetical protein